MTRVEVRSYPVTIWIAGDYDMAWIRCKMYCSDVGYCVSVTPTKYVYTAGPDSGEDGVAVGLINYPRFPSDPATIWAHAEALAAELRTWLRQDSYTIQGPDKTVWFSHRDEAA